jgi:hypothetical protein
MLRSATRPRLFVSEALWRRAQRVAATTVHDDENEDGNEDGNEETQVSTAAAASSSRAAPPQVATLRVCERSREALPQWGYSSRVCALPQWRSTCGLADRMRAAVAPHEL